ADKKILAEKLKAFSSKTLRILLKSYGLPTKKGDKPLSKKQLIDTIIKNISILSMSKKGKMPLSKKKSKTKKAKTKLSKTKLGETLKGKSELSTSKASTRRSTLTQIEGESTQNPSSFVTYRAEVAYGSNDEDEKGYRHAFMFGRVEITFSNKTLYADSVKVKLNKDGEPVEILAVGDILLEDKNHNRIVGEKIYFFPMIERAIFYKGQGLDKPFYVRGKVAHGVADSKYIFYKGLLTTCNLERPHYSINFSKAWYYDDQLFWAQDANYKIGNSVLLYTPFFYRSAITTGIRTAFGYERGINWFLHNTLAYIPGLSAEETLKRVNKKSSFEMRQSKLGMRFELDYYQKMGVQFGYELLYRDGGNMLLVDLGLAKDRSVKYDAGTQELILNYFDQDGDGVPEETNNFRWNIRTEGKFAIYSSSVFNSVLDLGFKTQSDPFYQNQFEKHRHQEFNIFDLLGLDDTNPDIVGGDRSLLSSSTGQQIRFGLANKLYGLTFQLSGDFGYLLQRDITDVWNPPKNPYTTDYYKNYKSIFLFPKIALGYTGSIMILGDEKPKLESDKQKEDLEKKRNETKYIKEFEGKSGYNPETQDNINTRNIVQPDVYLSADVKRKDRLVVNMPINYSLNFDFSEKRTYGTDQQNDLETDVFNDSSKLNLSIPLTLTYQFVKFSVTSSGSLRNQNQYTKEPDITEKQNDKELTYTNWDASFGGNLDFFFLEKY
ncbi:MAG: hypothetical protein OEZ36_13530, partial [Spirochaetota bacterium]|nr:hypothetical protein [Spirochaetota bacterium]